MAEVTLTQAVRASLLSLQGTAKLIEQTQGRLSSGLRVASAVDDPVSFFQSKGLGDRAFDFQERLNGIDQAISSVTAALDGVASIETLVRQLKGIAQSLKSAEAAQLTDLISQFTDLRNQINELASDSQYQGTNLINGTGTTLSVEFSQRSASKLDVVSVDLTVGTLGLSIGSIQSFTGGFLVSNVSSVGTLTGVFAGQTAAYATGSSITVTYEGLTTSYTAGSTLDFQGLNISVLSSVNVTQGTVLTVNFSTQANGSGQTDFYIADAIENLSFAATIITGSLGTAATAGETLQFTYNGLSRTFTTADNGILFSGFGAILTGAFYLSSGSVILGSGDVITVVLATGDNVAVSQGSSLGFVVDTTAISLGSGAGTGEVAAYTARSGDFLLGFNQAAFTAQVAPSNTLVALGDTTQINAVISELDTALTTLRTKAGTLGGNVSVLQTRLDFTTKYVNTLEGGAAKLTLADINEEGANLLALQTRQQLGIQALSFAGQAEQSILALFQ